MQKLQELKAQRNSLEAEQVATIEVATEENRELSADETNRIDEIEKQLPELEAQIGRLEKVQARQAAIAKRLTADKFDDEGVLVPESKKIVIPAKARARGRLKAFTNEEDAYISGQFLAATLFGNQASGEWLKDHGYGVKSAHSTDNNSKGGFTVPDPLESSLIRLVEERGVFRRNIGMVWPLPGGSLKIPKRSGGFTAYWPGENVAITESDLTFQQVALSAKKVAAATQISSELMEDSVIALAELLTLEFARVLANAEDTAGFNGDGTATYGGITGLANALAAGAIVTTASNVDTPAEIVIGNFQDAIAKLKRYPGIMPKWYMHSSMFHSTCERLAFAASGNTVQNYQGAMGPSFLGYPVEFVQCMEAVASGTDISGDIFAYFGDLGMTCAMGEARGMNISSSTEKYFLEDSLAVKVTERFDIQVHDVGDANDAGAMVAIKANAS